MDPLDRHHTELGRAAAAAMEQHYQEAIEICSELLTSGTYDELAKKDSAASRRARAEVRLLMATAMHYTDGHYDDIVKQLGLAMESPPDIQKDSCFTLAVVQLSFGHVQEARATMQQCLVLIASLRKAAPNDPALIAQEKEAQQFLAEMEPTQ
jgi:hypothetical protein